MTKMRKFLLVFLLISLGIFHFSGHCSEVISRISIEGNDRISNAKIISKIKIRSGQEYNDNIINDDVKALYSTGFFSVVNVLKKTKANEVEIVFKIEEKPIVEKINIKGHRRIGKIRIKEAIRFTTESFVDDYTLREAVSRIEDLYAQKGYTQAIISFDMDVDEKVNKAKVTFTVQENTVLKVRLIDVKGNKAFTRKQVLRILKTRQAWLFNRGLFKEDLLHDDKKRLVDFYRLQGFGDISVEIDYEIKPKGVYVNVTIVEGARSYVGDIKLNGNIKISTIDLRAAGKLKTGDIFSDQAVYEEVSKMREVYMDDGYIFAQIDPLSYFNFETQKVDITYKVVENQVAYVQRVKIEGNQKTKDKVIRRELRIYPGDRFDGKKIRKSKERLENLGFFEEVRLGTEPGSDADKIDMVVDVKEQKTGYLSFGGGYSSVDEFIGFIEVRQRNFDYQNLSTFTGAGQDLSVICSFGTLTENYSVNFTNPWIFDRPISFGFDAYKKGHKREENVGYAYEDDIRGGAVRFGKNFNDNIGVGASYRFERVNISDVIATATQELKDEAGVNDLCSGVLSFGYDTRDSVFSPLHGVHIIGSAQLTGGFLGGDKNFTKYSAQCSFYVPMINKSVIELKGRFGVADAFDNTSKVPIYERFFTGGSGSIRGYNERKVGPIDATTEDPIGGEALFVGNVEYTYPLADFIKLACFYDTGNVWRDKGDFLEGSLMSSVGAGVRVKTPIGPISIDYGWPLDLEPGEEKKEGRFHFNVSRGF